MEGGEPGKEDQMMESGVNFHENKFRINVNAHSQYIKCGDVPFNLNRIIIKLHH